MSASASPPRHTAAASAAHPSSRRPFLKLDHVDVTLRRGVAVVQAFSDVDLAIEEGEFVTIMGHSTSGRTALLDLIAGLAKPSAGAVLIEDREAGSPGPDRGVIFRAPSLLPWLSVYGNVRIAVDKAFGATKTRGERHDWTLHNLSLVGAAHAADEHPGELPGDMQQRVNIARALALAPKVLLMDEPFGAFDAVTRARMYDTVMDVHASLGITAVMTTRDADEAVLLSDRIVTLTDGPGARVGEVLRVTLPRPRRQLELVSDPACIAARAALLTLLHEPHNRNEAA